MVCVVRRIDLVDENLVSLFFEARGETLDSWTESRFPEERAEFDQVLFVADLLLQTLWYAAKPDLEHIDYRPLSFFRTTLLAPFLAKLFCECHGLGFQSWVKYRPYFRSKFFSVNVSLANLAQQLLHRKRVHPKHQRLVKHQRVQEFPQRVRT